MKKLLTLMMVAFIGLASPAFAMPEIGKPAPDFTAKDTNGVEHTLSGFKDKIVVLEWTNADCPYVVKHYGSNNMQTLQKDATDKGVVWVRINSSAKGKQGNVTAEEANKIAADQKVAATATILDEAGTIGRLYGAKTTPHMFVIAKDGTLAYAGAIDDKPTSKAEDIAGATNYVKAAYDALLAGTAVAVASSTAYGCSVKYE